jgi:2,4-dienoyl-CoA reductase-like NADH-dependent reductase (Old Yellow Enzyme family)
MNLSKEITLPCGAKLQNRLAKSAMSENMADNHLPGERYFNLYHRWSQGGLGLCITGNIMIDHRHLGEPNNVVLENEDNLEAFKKWARACSQSSMALWPQLNHPGKQIPKFITTKTVAPSAIPLDPHMRSMFSTPRELTAEEIWEIINRFANAARLSKLAGFHGVQIHGAHGYLVSQFLSEKHNQRQDEWGGSIEKRMRFPVEVYQAMRQADGANFPIGIKSNSADFQKGGFTHQEAILVCKKMG